LSTYPEVHLELAVGEAPIDIVAKGFDAGIGPSDRVPADMIAVRVMGPMKMAVVGAPTYFARRRPPRTPDDLARHSCVQYRRAADGDVFVWPFERDRKSRRISVDGRVMVNDTDLAIRAAVDGLGIAYTLEVLAEPFLRSGQLVRVLEDWSPSLQGLFLYYPGHRQVPATLRALIDMIRAAIDKTGERLKSPEVTIGMAKAEGWYYRNGSKWSTMPELMLCYRSATLFTRLYAPEIAMGIQTADEVVEIGPGHALRSTRPLFERGTKARSKTKTMLEAPGQISVDSQEQLSDAVTRTSAPNGRRRSPASPSR
jgi:hypothetical protein